MGHLAPSKSFSKPNATAFSILVKSGPEVGWEELLSYIPYIIHVCRPEDGTTQTDNIQRKKSHFPNGFVSSHHNWNQFILPSYSNIR